VDHRTFLDWLDVVGLESIQVEIDLVLADPSARVYFCRYMGSVSQG
jgi:hypothetical protein